MDAHFEPEVYSRFDDDINVYITENTITHKPCYERYQSYKYIVEDGCYYQVSYHYIIVRNKKMRLMKRAEMKDDLIKSIDSKVYRYIKQLIE